MVEKQKNNASSGSKAMDVAKPGKSAPSASSRPIIVGHKPMVQDPMVNESQAPASDDTTIEVKRLGSKVVKPLSDVEITPTQDDSAAADEQAVNSQSAGESEAVPSDSVSDEQAEEQPSVAASNSSESSSKGGQSKSSSGKSSSIVDAVIDQVSKDKEKKDDKKQAEVEKRQAEVEKLIEEKKYFVHTSQAATRQRKTRWMALLLMTLLLIGVYLAVDAQVVKNDIKLPYEFFKEQIADTESRLPVVTAPSDKNTKKDSTASSAFTGEVIESASRKFSIKVPDGWRMVLLTDSDGLYPEDVNTSDSLEYKSGEKPVITRQPVMGTDAPVRFSINYIERGAENGFLDENMTKTAITLNSGAKGTRYYYQEPLKDVEGLGVYPGEKQYIYEFETKDGGKVVVVYRILEKNQYNFANELEKSDPDRLEFIEEVVKTLKIN